MKTHLHDEQFDDHLHAVCARTDPVRPDSPRSRFFVDDLGTVPRQDRCRACARHWWPRGGEPE